MMRGSGAKSLHSSRAGQGHAVHRRQAGGEDDVVAVARRNHQGAGLEQLHGVGHGAGAEHDLEHAPLLVITGIEDARAEQVGNVAGAWGV